MNASDPSLSTSERFRALTEARQSELEKVMLRGEQPSLEAMIDWEYCGQNVAFWAEYSPILKFIKGFYRGPGAAPDRSIMGYNIPAVQNGRDRPWLASPSEEAPKRFGFYKVHPVDAAARDNAYVHALLLDYSQGNNPLWDPSRQLRDYLVRVEPGSDDLLLGKATVALGPLRVPTNFFVLQRRREVSFDSQ